MKKKILSFLIACLLLGAFLTGCTPKEETYEYQRESTTNMLKFSSSDQGMADFLNDYFHRHLRYDDKRIDYRDLGVGVTFAKEWEAYSLMFFDSTTSALPNDRPNMLKKFLDNIPVDRFGYVWNAEHSVQENDKVGNQYFHQGWPFPAYTEVQKIGAKGWEFANGSTEDWTSELNGVSTMTVVEDNAHQDGKLKIESSNLKSAAFISPYMENAYRINPNYAPFLELDMRMTDNSSDTGESFFEDIEVWWIHTGEDWDESRMVTYSDFSTMGDMTITSAFNRHIYFPMYLHPEWGTGSSNDDRIAQFKVVVKTKDDNKTHDGNVKLNFARAQFDTRQTNNIGIFLQVAAKHFEYTGDTETLSKNLARYRMAMQFLIGYCNGGENGLVDASGLPGHEGANQLTDPLMGRGKSIGNGYWDILSTPQTSFYANLFFYRAAEAMLYLERMAAENGIVQEMPKVWNKTATDFVSFDRYMTVDGLQGLLGRIKIEIQKPVDVEAKTGFWDAKKGRFIEGFDSNGDVVDYGYVMYNLEAIATGVVDADKAEMIMDWVSGKRIVEEDISADDGEYPTATGSQSYATGYKGTAVQNDGSISGEGTLGIYDYEFAPRVSTVKNLGQYCWHWNGKDMPYAEQLQDGGASMYVSYYDLLSRIGTYGADDAYTRLKEIQQWYEKVKAAAERKHAEDPSGGYDGKRFYNAYYDEIGIGLQGSDETGTGGAGCLGLGYEFLESAMLYATVPYGFFGIGSTENNVLDIAPSVPSSVSWWKMENLLYRGIHYDCTVRQNGIQIDYVRGKTAGMQISVSLPGKPGAAIYVDGARVESEYDAATGRVRATVPFKACKITVS